MLLVLGVLAVASVWALSNGPAGRAMGAATEYEVDLGMDVDTAGNTATSLGAQQTCGTLAAAGDTLAVDLVVRGIPPYDPVSDSLGVAGFQLNLIYDPAVVNVVGQDAAMLLTADGESILISLGDGASAEAPDADGDFLMAEADMSANFESGDGVLTRITLRAVGEGASALHLTEALTGSPLVADREGVVYGFSSIQDAEVTVGGSCTDGDFWSDALELLIGTDPSDMCADTGTPFDERGPGFGQPLSPQPPDYNDDTFVDISDINLMGPPIFNPRLGKGSNPSYDARFDLNADDFVDIVDVNLMGPPIFSLVNPCPG